MSNSVTSRQGSLMGATMSNKAVCFPISRSIGGCTERDLIGARASCGVPVPRSFVNGYNPWIGSSFGPSFRSNILPLPSMEYWNYTGATMSNKAVCFPSPYLGSSYVERDLLGAQMSNHTAHPYYSTYVGVQPINTHPAPMEGWASRVRNELSERDRLGADMSSPTPHPYYSTYVGVQPINAHPVSTAGWASRVRN
ncbi:hypothetical protein NC652_040111 [Populus alba x Populus x berolinensis]|uniref:Uncharacterized protein n=1 Tax=Populus alba TaxID=43335 RepID=A0A4V6AA98_POPAL|nr:hypothetical protein NC652_040111 [Populus alba x Populus x berolinensis]TKS10306.1 hypothetical protein D5086_0000083640 [Populus alba]